jgi:hypothetical protein
MPTTKNLTTPLRWRPSKNNLAKQKKQLSKKPIEHNMTLFDDSEEDDDVRVLDDNVLDIDIGISEDNNVKKPPSKQKNNKKVTTIKANNKPFIDEETALLLRIMRKVGKSWGQIEWLFNENTSESFRKRDNLRRKFNLLVGEKEKTGNPSMNKYVCLVKHMEENMFLGTGADFLPKSDYQTKKGKAKGSITNDDTDSNPNNGNDNDDEEKNDDNEKNYRCQTIKFPQK